MKFKVLDGFCFGSPYGDVYPGDVVELSPTAAVPYVRAGRLAPCDDADDQSIPPGPGAIEMADVPVVNRDPKPMRRPGAARAEKE